MNKSHSSNLTTHKSSSDHDGRYYTESEVDTKLNDKSNTWHTHDDRYYMKSEVTNLLKSKFGNSIVEIGHTVKTNRINYNPSDYYIIWVWLWSVGGSCASICVPGDVAYNCSNKLYFVGVWTRNSYGAGWIIDIEHSYTCITEHYFNGSIPSEYGIYVYGIKK